MSLSKREEEANRFERLNEQFECLNGEIDGLNSEIERLKKKLGNRKYEHEKMRKEIRKQFKARHQHGYTIESDPHYSKFMCEHCGVVETLYIRNFKCDHCEETKMPHTHNDKN